jgi:hypothetical protein
VNDELGERAFEDAAQRALVAIALAVQVEAHRKLGINGPALDEQVVPFPLERRRPRGRSPDDDVA